MTFEQLYILDNGKLYYDIGNGTDLNNRDVSLMKLYDKLSDIKRIKKASLTSGIDISLFLITNDGKVFGMTHVSGLTTIEAEYSLNELPQFSNYKIGDIISYEPASGPSGDTYSVILKDGTILEKTVEVNG